MRVSVSVILAAILAAPLASTASAADFEGVFVGSQIGWQSEKVKNPESSIGVAPVNETKKSVSRGVFAGYDKLVGDRFVLGAEAGLDFTSDDEVQSSVGGTSYTVDPKHSFDLTARAGYLATPRTLLYVRGGYTNARVRTTITDAGDTQSSSDGHDGWLVGPGAEYRINANVSARLEYRYVKFEDDSDHRRNRMLAGMTYRF